MILATCVVVDEFKCLDIPIREFSIILEHLPFVTLVSADTAACVLRAPHRLTRPAFEAHPGANTFPPIAHYTPRDRAPHGHIRFPQHFFSVHDHGRVRSSWEPALTLAWLYIEPSPCGGVRPAGDPVDSDPGAVFVLKTIPTLDRTLVPLEPWVCHHTREPTVLSRVSCRPSHLNFDRFHQPCLLAGRTSRIGEDCRPRTTWRPLTLWEQPVFLLCVSLEVLTTPARRCHGRMLIHPSSLHVPPRTRRVFAHTQVRDPRECAAASCGHALGTPSSWPSAACPAHPGSLEMISMTFAAVICDADEPCTVNTA